MSIQNCPDCGATFIDGQWKTALGKTGNPDQLASRACYYAKKKGLTNCINTVGEFQKEQKFNPPKIRDFKEYEKMAEKIKTNTKQNL